MIPFTSSFATALANHLWQSTLFLGAACLLSLLLREYSARVRYAIWLTASLKFLLPFSLLIALGGLLPKPHTATLEAQRETYSTMDTVGQPFSENVVPATGSVLLAHSTDEPGSFLPRLLLAVWLCGFIVVVAVWLARWRQVATVLRESAPNDAGREAMILRRLSGDRSVELRLSEGPMEPGIFGVFRPKLIWPQRLSERLEDEHIEAIVAHELTHVRRLDNLTAALHMLVEAVFWFHPAVWWMERHMVEERERACDEAVVERVGQADIYAESLLKACRFCVESPAMCVSGISGADLARRVRSIMTLHARKLGAVGRTALAVLAVATLAMPLAFGLVRMIPVNTQIYHPSEPMPSFEVTSVKVSQGGPKSWNLSPDVFPWFNAPASAIIMRAYHIPPFDQDHYLLNGPSWIYNERYDVLGKIDEDHVERMRKMAPEELHRDQMLMMQSMLADRFKLKVHFEMREMPVYELVVAKGGPKLTPSSAQPEVNNNIMPKGLAWDDQKKWVPNGQMLARPVRMGSREMVARAVTMDNFVSFFPWQPVEPDTIDRALINRTGLTGRYDLSLKWTARPPQGLPASMEAEWGDDPDLFTALEKQLGLKLVPSKGPVEVLVIDHIEKPLPN